MFCLAGPPVETHGGGLLVRPLSSTSIMLLHAFGVMGGLLPGAFPAAGSRGSGRGVVILLPCASHAQGALACAAAFARTMSDVGDGAGGGAGSNGEVVAVPDAAGGTEGGAGWSCAGPPWFNCTVVGAAAVCEGIAGCATATEAAAGALIGGGSGAAQCRPQSTDVVDRGLAIAVGDALQKFA